MKYKMKWLADNAFKQELFENIKVLIDILIDLGIITPLLLVLSVLLLVLSVISAISLPRLPLC